MWLQLLLAAVLPLLRPTETGLFESSDLFLVRVTAVEVADHPRQFGPNKLRIDDVLIGPAKLKGATAVYRFFKPSGEVRTPLGGQYSNVYPHFAYPAAKGEARYWWAEADKDGGWKTADFGKVVKLMPTSASKTLLKVGLKPDDLEAKDQAELVAAVVKLEAKRTRLEQFVYVNELRESKTKAVYLMADRVAETLTTPPKKK